MIVKSITQLSDNELNKIKSILKESRCPNESLRATFPDGFHHIDEEKSIIYFGAHSHDYTYEICIPLKTEGEE
jgi:hypothetical protein